MSLRSMPGYFPCSLSGCRCCTPEACKDISSACASGSEPRRVCAGNLRSLAGNFELAVCLSAESSRNLIFDNGTFKIESNVGFALLTQFQPQGSGLRVEGSNFDVAGA